MVYRVKVKRNGRILRSGRVNSSHKDHISREENKDVSFLFIFSFQVWDHLAKEKRFVCPKALQQTTNIHF